MWAGRCSTPWTGRSWGAEALCIEDYAKGVCTPEVCAAAIRRSRAAGVPVFVDPAAIKDYSKYRGATVITPNRTEAALALDMRPLDDAEPIGHAGIAQRLLSSLELEACVITLDRHGALLLVGLVPLQHFGRDGLPLARTLRRLGRMLHTFVCAPATCDQMRMHSGPKGQHRQEQHCYMYI